MSERALERCESAYPGDSVPGCEKPRGHDGEHAALLGIHLATEDYPEQEEWAEWSDQKEMTT